MKRIFLLIYSFIILTASAEKSPYYEIKAYKFKQYLEAGKIKSVTGGGYDIEGTYENENGEIQSFRVDDLYNHNPFLDEGLQKQGLTLGPRYVIPYDDYGFTIGPEEIIVFSILGSIILLLLSNLIFQIRIYKLIKKT